MKNVKTSDVDMQAITDRLLCMGRPWENRTSKESRRNNVYDISAFLNKSYYYLYLVFNLSNGRVYPLKPFNYQVLQFEPERSMDIDKMGCPSLEEIFNVCYAIKFWLNLNYSNIAVLHCDNGVSRTKLFAACYLLFSGECKTMDEALLLFYRKRLRKPNYTMLDVLKRMSSSAKQVTQHFARIHDLKGGLPNRKPLVLRSILIHNLPTDFEDQVAPYIELYEGHRKFLVVKMKSMH